MRTLAMLAIIPLSSGLARAGGVIEEVGAGTTPATAAAPGSRWISDKLAGVWDASERWQLRLDLSSTRPYSDDATTRRGDVYTAQVAAALTVDDHWSARLSVTGSPPSTTHATVAIAAGGLFGAAIADAQAELRDQAAALSAGLSLDYDAASDDLHSVAASLSFAATYASTQQDLAGAAAGDHVLDADAIRARCVVQACPSMLATALTPQLAQLGQFMLGASVTDTLDRDTDLSVDAAYFFYDRDPMQAGYTALASIGAGTGTLTSATGVTPIHASLTPSVAQRWGDLSVTTNLTYTDYTDNLGLDFSAGVRVQYKLALSGARRLKLYAKLGVGLHVDTSVDHPRSGSAGVGAGYSW